MMKTSIRNNIEMEGYFEELFKYTNRCISKNQLIKDSLNFLNKKIEQMDWKNTIEDRKISLSEEIKETSIEIGNKKEVISINLNEKESKLFEQVKNIIANKLLVTTHVNNNFVFKACIKSYLIDFIDRKNIENFMLKKIEDLNDYATELEIMDIVEFDLKDLTTARKNDKVDEFFSWRTDKINNVGAEDTIELKGLYKKLNWDGKTDIINSFIIYYSWGLCKVYPEKFEYYSAYKVVKTKTNNFQIAKSCSFLSRTYKQYCALNNLGCINELAKLTHTIGNIMPVIDGMNTSKGFCSDIQDIMDLFLIIVENNKGLSYKKDGKEINIEQKTLEKWRDFLNESNTLLEINDYKIIKNIEELENMSLDEYIQLIFKINIRIKIRGINIIKTVSKNIHVREICDKMIQK